LPILRQYLAEILVLKGKIPNDGHMKFVFFGYDFSLDVAKRLIQDGHKLAGVFTFECDNVFNFNKDIIALAQQNHIPYTLARPTKDDIDYFIAQGTDLFFSCGYPYKIPEIDENKAYAVNTHPSRLPRGRGLMPTPHIIINHPDAAGFTLHKITARFDQGDILYQEAITLTDQDTVETYSSHIANRTPDIASAVVADLPQYWAGATPQNEAEATYFPPPDEEMRTLRWEAPITHIDRTARAFGKFGSLAFIDGALYAVFEHDYRQEPHTHITGTIINADEHTISIAASDGIFIMKRFMRL
jgi:UDP-4-amino-4-deoxy-L-arabinose formyltransferase/UDP-glucuronic acid dehydrogenase (UDP-4-keto-hexauronic acid decarboxylating)